MEKTQRQSGKKVQVRSICIRLYCLDDSILQEEIDICKVCMLTTFARLRAQDKEGKVDRWDHWTTAVQRTENIKFDKQEQIAREICNEQVCAAYAMQRLTDHDRSVCIGC